MPDLTPQIRHYDAATAPRGMFRYVTPLAGYPRVIWENRFLISNFFTRELLGRFRGSLLGVFWVLLQPLFMFTVYYLVFGMLLGNQRLHEGPDPNFAFYMFSGMIAFQAIIEGTTLASGAVVNNGNLVKKVAFPSEVLPIDVCLVSLVVYLVGAFVCMLALFTVKAFGYTVPSMLPGWSLLLLPLTVAVQFALMLGIGLFLANLYVFARDVRQIWMIVTSAWMFLTPVFWIPNDMEDRFGPVAHTLFACNPAYSIVMAQRIALGATDARVIDERVVHFGDFWSHLGFATAWAAFFMVIGYATFMSRKHRYADLV